MNAFEKLLSGNDLRSIGRCDEVISKVKNQRDFDELFRFLLHNDRIVVMHAADAVEKITISNPDYLAKHKKKLIELLNTAVNKELKWHLGLMISRLNLKSEEFSKTWDTLTKWAKDKTNSRLVRVGAVQGLYEMTKKKASLIIDFNLTALELEQENIPSVNARIRNIRKEMGKETT